MLLITGLSGSGKSTALHALEDAGFFCTDNLPVEMLHDWSLQMGLRQQPSAVCLDIRSGMNAEELRQSIAALLTSDEWRLLYIEASDEVLQRRFSALRRRHPYKSESSLMHSIEKERESMQPLREMADLVLDSSALTPYQLAEKVDGFWRRPEQRQRAITCSIISFSYGSGLPPQADMVLDMRILPNPHYHPELAQKTGSDAEVIAFFEQHEEAGQAEQLARQWLSLTWPLMKKERKQYFTLAVGCTGGRHRSVYMAERLAAWIHDYGWGTPTVQHRELGMVYQWPPGTDHHLGGSI